MYSLNEKVVLETLHKYGNCIAASIPLTLVDAIENKKINRGDICLFTGTSAGFAIGSLLIKYWCDGSKVIYWTVFSKP